METPPSPSPPGPRLWPLGWLLSIAATAILAIRLWPGSPYQEQNLRTLMVGVGTFLLTLLWWILFSRVPWRRRGFGLLIIFTVFGLTAGMFRIRGVSGDLLPILELRWKTHALPTVTTTSEGLVTPVLPRDHTATQRPDFPQYLGPNRDTTLPGPALAEDWLQRPPQIIWRQPVGAAWSGFVIVGERALTQEQRGDEEWITCRELLTGKLIWEHADAAKYDTVIAGAGPRQTPVVVKERVYTLGATGKLNCLDLLTGRRLWGTNILSLATRGTESKDGTPSQVAKIPDWGFAGSPLVTDDLVIVQPGGDAGRSLAAFRAETGELVWTAGDGSADYSSPTLLTLGGVRQVLIFTSKRLSSHDPATGKILWQHPFGSHFPLVANPLAIGPDRVVISAGYGVGAQLIEPRRATDGTWAVTNIWTSRRLKAKFHHPVRRGDYIYGLDDGVWACVSISDGTQIWKSGRYGHGQGLLVGDHYLLMAENGELKLLSPDPKAAMELASFRVFDRKTWNPIALSGEYLLVRNDAEAVLLKLALH